MITDIEIQKLEAGVLGSFLYNFNDYAPSLGLLKPQVFSCNEHKVIFQAIQNLSNSGKPVDILTTVAELNRIGQLTAAGGPVKLSELLNNPILSRIDEHCLLINQAHIKRQISLIGIEATNAANDPTTDSFELLERLDTKIKGVLDGIPSNTFEMVGDVASQVVSELYTVLKDGARRPGIMTGIERFNRHTSGFQPSTLNVIAARPGAGKTSFAIDCALTPALNGTPTGFLSLEMENKSIGSRILSIMSGVNVSHIENKTCTADEVEAVREAAMKLSDIPLHMDETGGLTLQQVAAKARKLKRDHGIKLLVIDYLQLMKGASHHKGNREGEISEISRGLKGLAKEMKIPIIALSQLNRKCEERPDKKPILSDLRESGAIEQDADMIIFLHRPEYWGQDKYMFGDETISSEGLLVMIIGKYRNGQCGEIRARFIGSNTSVTNF